MYYGQQRVYLIRCNDLISTAGISNLENKCKGKVVPVPVTKAYRDSRSTATLSRNLGSR